MKRNLKIGSKSKFYIIKIPTIHTLQDFSNRLNPNLDISKQFLIANPYRYEKAMEELERLKKELAMKQKELKQLDKDLKAKMKLLKKTEDSLK